MIAKKYDVLVIGGSHSGLSAAMALGRMLRTAIVADDGRPRNLVSMHANNIAGSDGIHPELWRERARRDLEKYKTIALYQRKVLEVQREDGQFIVRFEGGASTRVRKVILAYGLKDKFPAAAGFETLWGKSVFHCPYCHGFEIRGQRLGIVGNGNYVEHMLPMVLGLSKDVVIFTNGPSEISTEFTELSALKNVVIHEEKIEKLSIVDDKLHGVYLEGGTTLRRDALFLGPQLPFESNSNIGTLLGCEKDEFGKYTVQMMGKTTASSVFVAGDIMTMHQSVVGATASGQAAGSGAVFELLSEDYKNGFEKLQMIDK